MNSKPQTSTMFKLPNAWIHLRTKGRIVSGVWISWKENYAEDVNLLASNLIRNQTPSGIGQLILANILRKTSRDYIPTLTSTRSGELVTSSRLTIYIIIEPFSFLIGAINTEQRNAVPKNFKNFSLKLFWIVRVYPWYFLRSFDHWGKVHEY